MRSVPAIAWWSPTPPKPPSTQQLYALYRKLYFAFGERQSDPVAIGDVLPELRHIAAKVRGGKSAGHAAS